VEPLISPETSARKFEQFPAHLPKLILVSRPSLPDLTNVKGGFNVQSTASIDCSGFQSEKGSVIQGTFTCGTTANPTTKGSGTGTVTGSSASSTSTKGAASSYGVSETLAGLGLIGTLMHMLL
jgi:hypothetical protein